MVDSSTEGQTIHRFILDRLFWGSKQKNMEMIHRFDVHGAAVVTHCCVRICRTATPDEIAKPLAIQCLLCQRRFRCEMPANDYAMEC